jgi:hypothetical protein
MERYLRIMNLWPRHVVITYISAMHDMVRHVRSKLTQLVQNMFPLLHQSTRYILLFEHFVLLC